MVAAPDVLERLRGEDRRILPRLATLIENEDPAALRILDHIYGATGSAHIVGVTGPPGSGKSTLIATLIDQVRQQGRRIGVIAVDPSSPLSGGAVLGDRIRMMERHSDSGVFIRSMASRGRRGGLAWATASLVHLLDAARFDVVVVETIGTGQDGTDIASLADTVVVVEAPGLGDGVQAIKSGLLEVGDVVVVNKADLPGANEALRILRSSLALGHSMSSWRVPILPTSTSELTGIDRLLESLDAHRTWLSDTEELGRRRTRAARAEVLAGLRVSLEHRLDTVKGHSPQLSDLIVQVAIREISPRGAVQTIVSRLDV